MKLADDLKTNAKKLKKEIVAIYYAYRNPGTNIFPKLLILFTLGYALSPIDLIPDFIPVLGYLDDLIILPGLIALSIKLIPHDIWAESRELAENKPLQLRKNWLFAIFFILIWIGLASAVIISIVKQ